jgi:ElaB/YqjD/DUF883 family membrane-anchored ribosome-binding protein
MVEATVNDTLIEDAADTTETAKRSAADAIREEVGKYGSQAAERARSLAGEGKDKATEALDEVAKMMKSAAGDVDDKLGEDYGRYARSAAEGISGFAETLRGKQVDEIFEDVGALVKKSPVIAIGTAAAIGFVLARLIKSGIDAASDLADRDEPAGPAKS